MSSWDKKYLNLCKKIFNEGTEVQNRTGINSIKVPSHHFHFDLEEEFPILTTKQLFLRQAVLEMLWIYQANSNDVRWLKERDVHIWDEWEIGEDGIWKATQNVLGKDGKLEKKEIEKEQKIQENLRKQASNYLSVVFGDSNATETNILKIMLYNETNGHCAYCNKPLNINDIFTDNIQVDHILPISKSFNEL